MHDPNVDAAIQGAHEIVAHLAQPSVGPCLASESIDVSPHILSAAELVVYYIYGTIILYDTTIFIV